MSEQDYTAWIGQEIKKMIDLLTNRSYKSNPDAINTFFIPGSVLALRYSSINGF